MTELRQRMLREMTLRGFSQRTHKSYIGQMVRLVRHYRRSPDQITNDEVQSYLAHLLRERKLSWSTCSQAAHAFRFFYHDVLGHDRSEFHVPAPRQPQKLPEILSRQEVCRLLATPPNPKHRLLLATIYAAGLRVSEAVALKVSDIDADRMTVRVQQGKGAKDRYVHLSVRLLSRIRVYWKTHPPGTWLFPNRKGNGPIDISVAQRVYVLAKHRAGITKHGGVHALRHAYATHAIESGTDLGTVQYLLGHRHITTTMRYFHLSRSRIIATPSPFDLPDPTSA